MALKTTTSQKPSIFLQQNKLGHMALRTADERFEGLSDWQYTPKYVSDLPQIPGLRMHYIDEGKQDALRTVLCLHGQKTWSYAFRKAIPYFLRNSFRVIALDLFGFGRSDKLPNDNDYSFEFHRNSVIAFIEHLGLDDLYIAGFDWGGWIGATLPMTFPQEISRLILGNMAFHTSEHHPWPGFHLWRSLHNAQNDPMIGESLFSHAPAVYQAEISAYNAPFPSLAFKAGVRKFPNLIPESKNSYIDKVTSEATNFLQTEWNGTCVCIAGLQDPVLGLSSMQRIQSIIRNASPVIKLPHAGSLVFEHADEFLETTIEILK